MHRPHGRWPHWLLVFAVVVSGCQPRHPFYLRHNDDLATYIDHATELAYPDLEHASLDETAMAQAPLTLTHPEFQTFWDLSLQEAVQTALHNSKVVRSITPALAGRGAPDVGEGFLARPETFDTVYDAAAVESDPNRGVEAALAAFDAQFTSSLFWNTTDRPQNFLSIGAAGQFFPSVQKRNAATFTAEVNKRSATGTQFFFRNITEYDRSNTFGQSRALSSFYTTQFETEVRHPLLRGNGARVNRVPVLIARINTDIELAEFEANVRNLVQDVENAYWNLHCAYRVLQARKAGRDITLEVWRATFNQLQAGVAAQQLEAQARQQYYTFRAQTEEALNNLYNAETNLRWLMGLAVSDGRLIRPIDEPTNAKVAFEWPVVSAEAQVRSPELRRIKWFIKQRELEQIAARNRLLPELNVVGLYRWFGAGDNLINADRNGLDFPTPGSTAFDVLTQGKFEEARVGFDFAMPIGFRQEYAAVRNAQINLAREHARLEDAELAVSTQLGQAIRNMVAQYSFAQSQYNALIAARDDVEAQLALVRAGVAILGSDATLRTIQRQVQSEELFYISLCEYNKAIAFVHFRKNSLLEYNNVFLAEGPWPEKAYFDAEGHARRRAASFYLDYGWTQPPPVSAGPAPRGLSDSLASPFFAQPAPGDAGISAEPIPTPPPAAPNDMLPAPLPPGAGGPNGLELAPPAPPLNTMGLNAGAPRSTLRATAYPPAKHSPAQFATAPPPTTYPAFPGGAPSALAYQGFSSPRAALDQPTYSVAPAISQYATPAPPHGGAIAPAAYYAPAAESQPPLNRLPPTRPAGP